MRRLIFSSRCIRGVALALVLGLFVFLYQQRAHFDQSWLSSSQASVATAASLTEAPLVDAASCTITPPKAGVNTQVFVKSGAIGFSSGNPVNPGEVLLVVLNQSQGTQSSPIAFNPTKGSFIDVDAGYQDLLTLSAIHGVLSTSIDLGYVSAGADIAAPEIDHAKVSSSFAAGLLTVTVAGKGVGDDNGVTAVLVHEDGTAGAAYSVPLVGLYSKNDFSLSLGASLGDRLSLVVSDDFGNSSEVQFTAGVSNTYGTVILSTFAPNYASPTQSPYENTANTPMTDGGVMLHGLEYVKDVPIVEVGGADVGYGLQLSYRSGIEYEGLFGDNWDSTINARLRRTQQNGINFFPGDGRTLLFENGQLNSNFDIVYGSPAGEFRQMTYHTGLLGGEAGYSLATRAGDRLWFNGGSGFLERVENSYGANIQIIRDKRGRPLIVLDDRGYRALVFSYYEGGHLASVRNRVGATWNFDYDSDGQLTQIHRPVGDSLDWKYVRGGANNEKALLIEMYDASGRLYGENRYDSTGAIKWQRWAHALKSGEESYDPVTSLPIDPSIRTQFVRAGDLVRVTDPEAGQVTYTLSNDGAQQRIAWISNYADRAGNPEYPGAAADPISWTEHFSYASNLLVSESYRSDSNQGGMARERVTWTYASPDHYDPRKRMRVSQRVQHAGGSPTTTFVYGADGEDYYPSSEIDPRGNITHYLYNSKNQLTETSKTVAAYLSAPAQTIRTQTVYDSTNGRISQEFTANRLASPTASGTPVEVFEYYPVGHISEGLLKSQTQQDGQANSATAIVTSFEYNSLGWRTLLTDSIGGTRVYTYDLLGRKLSERSPQGFTNYWTYSGDDLIEELSPVSHPAAGAPGVHRINYLYDSTYGFLTAVESDFEWDSTTNAMKRLREEYSYDHRGNITRKEKVGAEGTRLQKYSYDARSLILSASAYGDYSPGFQAPAVTEWFQYDFAGRVVQRFEPGQSTPMVTSYNALGHKYQVDTPSVYFGKAQVPGLAENDPLQATEFWGQIRKEWVYDLAGNVLVERELARGKETEYSDPNTYYLYGGWTINKEKRFEYNSANRLVRQLEARTRNPQAPTDPIDSDQWADWQTVYFEGGQVYRRYSPIAPGEAVSVTENQIDDFGRVFHTQDSAGNVREVDFDLAGRIEESRWKPVDEVDSIQQTYITTFEFDSLGRVLRKVFKGTSSLVLEDVGTDYIYDSRGLLLSEKLVRLSFSGNVLEVGMEKEYQYNHAGAIVSSKTGTDFNIGYQKLETLYNSYGDVESEIHGGASETRLTSYERDGMGRLSVITHPTRVAGAAARTTKYFYDSITGRLASDEDAVQVKKNYTHNALGQLVETVVDLSSAPSEIGGPSSVVNSFGVMLDNDFIGGQQVLSTTTMNGADVSNTVWREYDAQSQLLRERVMIPEDCGDVTTSFRYTPAGLRNELDYPLQNAAQVGDRGSRVKRSYRSDGVLRSVAIEDGGNWVTTMAYKYIGNQLAQTKNYAISGDLLYTKNLTFDEHLRAFGSTYSNLRNGDAALAGIPGQPELRLNEGPPKELLTLDWMGRVITETLSDGKFAHRNYDNLGRMSSAVMNSTSAVADWSTGASHGTDYTKRVTTFNEFGEVDSIDEYTAVSSSGQIIDYTRDDAGYTTAIDNQIIQSFGGIHGKSINSRAYQSNDLGQGFYSAYTLGNSRECAGGSSSNEATDFTTFRTYDAWGREILTETIQVAQPNTYSCEGALSTTPVTTVTTVNYDGFGRRVLARQTSSDPAANNGYETTAYAYEVNTLISEIRLDCVGGQQKVDKERILGPRNGAGKNRSRCRISDPDCPGPDPDKKYYYSMGTDLLDRVVVTTVPCPQGSSGPGGGTGNGEPEDSPELFFVETSLTPWGHLYPQNMLVPEDCWEDQFSPGTTGEVEEGVLIFEGQEALPGSIWFEDKRGGENLATNYMNNGDSAFFSESAQAGGLTVGDLVQALIELEKQRRALLEQQRILLEKLDRALKAGDLEQATELIKDLKDLQRSWIDLAIETGDLVELAKDLGLDKLVGPVGDFIRGLITNFELELDGQQKLFYTIDEADLAVAKLKSRGYISGLIHDVLDVLGMLPIVGNFADIANAGLHLIEGNYAEAGMALAAAIPYSGLGVGTAKLIKKINKRINCFVEGTLVHTDEGLKEIQDVEVGDKVWAYDESSGEWSLRTVMQTFKNEEYEGDLVEIEVGEEKFTSTGGHPFYVVAGQELEARPEVEELPVANSKLNNSSARWVSARDLKRGDRVLLRNGEQATVSGLHVQGRVSTTVYNLEVRGLHNYAVGGIGVLAHNISGGAKSVDDVLDGATKGKKGKTKQFGKKGGVNQANKDFDDLVGEVTITNHGDGIRSATLPDGSTVSVRPGSTQGSPTIQINPLVGKATKIRYGS